MTNNGFDILGLDHVQLAMPAGGEGLARRFYGDILGMAERPKPAHLAARGGCWFERGGLRLHLGVEAPFHPAHKAHPAILVRGLAALRRRLESAGYVLAEDEPLEGFDRCYVEDPFGNRIELMERHGSVAPS